MKKGKKSQVRRQMQALGFDTWNLSDEELETKLARVADMLRDAAHSMSLGVTVAEAAASFQIGDDDES